MSLKIACTDIETDNLYHHVTTFHCAWIIEPVTGKKFSFRPDQFKQYIEKLMDYDILIGHNVIDYDFPTLKKLCPSFVAPAVFDTLVLSRMLEPDRIQGHSLKSWGVALGLLKGDYGEQEDAWDVFTEAMFEYCERDVEVTVLLYKHLCEIAGFDIANPPTNTFKF